MFKGRKPDDRHGVDVNDYIVGDDVLVPTLDSTATPPNIPNDEIIDADYACHPEPDKRLAKSKIFLLVIMGVFAAGGVASVFDYPRHAEQPTHVAEAQPSEQPPTEIALPPGLLAQDGAPAVDTQTSGPAVAVQPTPTDVASNHAGLPSNQNSPTPSAPSIAADATPAPTATNPVLAQIAEAQKLAAPQPAPTASPQANTAATTKPNTVTDPRPIKVQEDKVASVKPSLPKTVDAPLSKAPEEVGNSVKPKPAVVAPAQKPVVPPAKPAANAQPKQAARLQPSDKPATGHDTSEEAIKRLVTVSAEEFGLQSIQEGAITLEPRRGNVAQRLHVGDRLPSGEQIIRIDARSTTLVTDRSVIRIN